MNPLRENYYALLLSGYTGVGAEVALATIYGEQPQGRRNRWTKEQIDDMRRMRAAGAQYTEIGEKFGISRHRARDLIRGRSR